MIGDSQQLFPAHHLLGAVIAGFSYWHLQFFIAAGSREGIVVLL